MKNILISTIMLCMALFVQSCANAQNAEEFATYLQSIIASDDKESFRKLLRLQNPGDEAYKAEQIDYVFHSQSSNIRTMLMDEKTQMLAMPFMDTEGGATGKFIIIYYNPDVIDFTKPILQEQLEAYWLNGYVETAIQLTEYGWLFIDSAFFQGSSPSWVDDY